MDDTFTQSAYLRKVQLLRLLPYTVVLCLCAQIYVLLSGYELFMQTLVTLFPVVALFALLVLAVAGALLLASGISLWLLLVSHLFIACWWLASFYIQTPAGFRKFDVLWDWYNLGFILVSLLPPLLGYALLKLRKRRYSNQQANAPEAAFCSAADILGQAEASGKTTEADPAKE